MITLYTDKDLNDLSVSNGNLLSSSRNDVVADSDVAIKFDSDKPRLDLLPAYSLEEIAKVLGFGSKKYNSWNWTKGFKWSRLSGAALRHLFAHMRGEDKDPETGMSHLSHAGCCILFLIWHERHRKDLDDRHIDPVDK